MSKEVDKVIKKDVGKKPERRIRNRKMAKEKPMTKVIIRLLPPTMTEEEFIQQIEPLPDHENYYYVPADWSLGQDATCRAYITFTNPDDVFLFTERFDGYVFVDNKGAEYPVVVEYAPFQGLPKNRSRKKDPKVNTIESEPHFIRFLEKMKEDKENKNEIKVEFNMQPKDVKKITSTPLLQYLADKAESRRNGIRKQNEESRKQRTEDRQQRNQRNNPTSAVKEDDKNSNRGKEKDRQKDGKSREEQKDRREERKELYIKKRIERDQRRREKREQRKSEREKNFNDKKTNQTASVSKDKPKPVKDTFYQSSSAKQNLADAEPKRREVKKYSERRDRNRSKPDDKTTAPDELRLREVEAQTVQPISAKLYSNTASNEINDSVQNFIDTVSKIREFVPKDKLVAKSIEEIEKQEFDKLKQINQQNNKKMESSLLQSENTNQSKGNDLDNSNSTVNVNTRRIRNKDRPSLQIYKPGNLRNARKPESESSSAEAKESKSTSTSDCEYAQNNDKKRSESGRASVEPREQKSTPTSECESQLIESFSNRRKSDGYAHTSDCDSLNKEPSEPKVIRYSQKRLRRAKENNNTEFDEIKHKTEDQPEQNLELADVKTNIENPEETAIAETDGYINCEEISLVN